MDMLQIAVLGGHAADCSLFHGKNNTGHVLAALSLLSSKLLVYSISGERNPTALTVGEWWLPTALTVADWWLPFLAFGSDVNDKLDALPLRNQLPRLLSVDLAECGQ